MKSTPQGHETIGLEKRLQVQVSKKNVDRLVAFPAPTYVVGIDEEKWRGYLLSINETRATLANFPTKFPLNRKNMRMLWNEVEAFWSSRNMILKDSFFRE